MLRYNYDGTVSDITINAIIDKKITSSLAVAPSVNTSGSTGLTTASNFTYQLQTTLSNSSSLGTAFYQTLPSASGIVIENFAFNNTTPLYISSNTKLNSVIDADGQYIDADNTNLNDGSISPNFNNITADKFTTTYSNGVVLVVGDDSTIRDVNIANGIGIVGQQQNNRGWVKFGNNGGPVWGHNGNNATTPLAGDGLYSITGSLLVSSSKLLYYNGASTNNGWSVIK
jgi:hypothetical protein